MKASLKLIINAYNFSQHARTLLNEIVINPTEFRNARFPSSKIGYYLIAVAYISLATVVLYLVLSE